MTALPTTRLEDWKYTDLRPLQSFGFANPVAHTPLLPNNALPRMVFLNGMFSAALSSPVLYLQKFTPVTEATAQPLALINAAHAHDGAVLGIPAGVDAGALLLVSHAEADAPFAFTPRHRVTLAAGATLTLVEVMKGEGEYWHNQVSDITLEEGARLTHIRLQDESAAAYNTMVLRAHVAQDAAYEHFTAVTGGKLSRTEIHATLTGKRALAHLNAVQLLAGAQHGDCTFVVRHVAPDCTSRQVVKSVLADRACGVFQGRIEVAKAAQKTDGYQMTRALLLSEEAEMNIKPELEIFADDVKCSHGAAIGALDAEQLFYLRSRGIPVDAARKILIHAFLDEALEPVTQPEARSLLAEATSAWWARQ